MFMSMEKYLDRNGNTQDSEYQIIQRYFPMEIKVIETH